MRESDLYRGVDQFLPPGLHRQSMTGTVFNGTLDRYYDGPAGDAWVEYKQIAAWPRDKTFCVMPLSKKEQPRGHLTDKQLRWLERRWGFGRNAAVVFGLPDKTAMILDTPDLWRQHFHCTPTMNGVTREEVAKWLMSKVWIKS